MKEGDITMDEIQTIPDRDFVGNVEQATNNKDEKKIPIWEKLTLTIDEAVAYSGIGKNKLRELTGKPFCPFVLHNGTKRLVKRKEFEKYLSVQKSI